MPKFSPTTMRRFMSWWPPYLGAGIRVERIEEDGSRVVTSHTPRLLTKNIVNTAFGGTIQSMTDPFFMYMSMVRLGGAYNVWDVEADVTFRKPGRGKIVADMRTDDATFDLIREKTADGSKYLHWFEVDVVDGDGDVVATVRRRVYFRRKKRD
ncbi:PaaI family thioesterase [Corynebacterium nuruki]|jgi:acyl-coenzyme A thioesterase PaaI-like protein|uniref:DUF4442 domain-containing protein n=1 Tax=Corynebacterium nuruki TaxID=1032851 RepID=A0A3D4SX12_9CORY|nr:DUF4442 domain-containing protein [Corynebacterium nuruki]MDN6438290.1 DUF4442 domain-containing protein [Corynebacterium nuruki]HCT13816.1 DUF4442 domain-containing protein [Corynebacterium nuruki]